MNQSCWQNILVALLLCCGTACSPGLSPQYFHGPNDALRSLEEVVSLKSVNGAKNLFGPEGDYLLYSGDKALDRSRGARFVRFFEEAHRLEEQSDGKQILLVGKKEWPFPVPLVKGQKGWFFDAVAGREEILTRRIGENELRTLEVSRNVYLAQRTYAGEDWDNDGVFEYAEHIISTPGSKDGLYWPEGESPLGPLIAQAADEEYVLGDRDHPNPYHGYFYKLFSSAQSGVQTPRDGMSKPGKYWLIAYPSDWGLSGIMTFATNERGWIYEKNLGEEAVLPSAASKLSIDASWSRVE